MGARAKFLVFAGVDGSGKTTVIDLFTQTLSEQHQAYVVYHWRPSMLPTPRKFLRKKTTHNVSKPHASRPHPAWMSAILSVYYLLDFWAGYLFSIRPGISQGKLIIYQRYYYDLLFDPKRYRLTPLPGLYALLARLVPPPHVVILLTGDPNAIYERKKEISLEEVQRQQSQMVTDFPRFAKVLHVDTTQCSPEQAVALISEYISAGS